MNIKQKFYPQSSTRACCAQIWLFGRREIRLSFVRAVSRGSFRSPRRERRQDCWSWTRRTWRATSPPTGKTDLPRPLKLRLFKKRYCNHVPSYPEKSGLKNPSRLVPTLFFWFRIPECKFSGSRCRLFYFVDILFYLLQNENVPELTITINYRKFSKYKGAKWLLAWNQVNLTKVM